jgi:LysM repeat protein
VVQKGHTLSAISGRYGITVGAICTANDLDKRASLEVGQSLVIPAKTDTDGRYARKLRLEGRIDEPSGGGSSQSWKQYEKPAWRRGYIKIRRYGRAWQGYVIGSKGEVLGHASNKINFVMGSHDDGPEIDPRLVRLIAQISDKFGGRELRIVSGYRTQSFVAASKHKEGRAIDFSIPGVPNEALRDYLRTLGDVGVGYYPNSSFVHLDVRSYSAYWVDYAGPGEAPKKSPHAKKRKGQPIESDEPPDGPSEGPASDSAPPDAAPPDDAQEPPSGDGESGGGSAGAGSAGAGSAGAGSAGAGSEGADPSGEKAKSAADADVSGAED